jgi:hypothetical protein
VWAEQLWLPVTVPTMTNTIQVAVSAGASSKQSPHCWSEPLKYLMLDLADVLGIPCTYASLHKLHKSTGYRMGEFGIDWLREGVGGHGNYLAWPFASALCFVALCVAGAAMGL